MTDDPARGQLPLALALQDHAVFETFRAPGDGELVAAARDPAPPGLWIAGPPGSGKSHLLQAVCAHRPERRCAYVPLGSAPAPEMLEGLEALDLVCLDDFDRVVGEERWERALFRLVNGLSLAGSPLVVAAAAPPSELGVRLPDLVSRCQALALFRLRYLDDEERLDTASLAASRRLTIPFVREVLGT